MSGRAAPHINDFLNQLYTLRDKAGAEAREETNAILAKNAARGLLRSGATLRQLAELIETKFEQILTAMLQALQHASSLPGLDYGQMRDQTFLRAQDLIPILRGACDLDKWASHGGPAAQKAIDHRLSRLPERLELRMRQFEVGLDQAAQPKGSPVTNNFVHAHTISGIVQQGGAGSTLSAALEMNFEQINEAVSDLLAEIEKVQDQSSNAIRQLSSDVGTIRSQLVAPMPRPSIMREAGHSIRNVIEGGVGGTLTPSLMAAAMALAHVLTG